MKWRGVDVAALHEQVDLLLEFTHAGEALRLMARSVMSANQRSTWLSQERYVGVKCM